MENVKVIVTCAKRKRVMYEVEFYTKDGEFLGRRFMSPKRRAERVMNIWKKAGYDVKLRRLRRSEWLWVNPADIEREEK